MATIASIWALLSRKSTWVTLAVVLGVLLAGFAVMNYVAVKSENMALSSQLEDTKRALRQVRANNRANQKAVVTRNTLLEALAEVETVERVKTIEALKANPDWASQPIPADVLASLRN